MALVKLALHVFQFFFLQIRIAEIILDLSFWTKEDYFFLDISFRYDLKPVGFFSYSKINGGSKI